MNVLVTGGAGFIGAHLVQRLASAGHRVRVLDNLSPQIHGTDPARSALRLKIEGCCEFVQADVRDRAAVEHALVGCDAVVHLAAETGTGQSMYQISHYSDVNVQGTAVLMEAVAARRAEVARVVVASSRAVHGEGRYSLDGRAVYPRGRNEEDMKAGWFEPRCPQSGRELTLEPTDESAPVQPNSIYGLTKYAQESMTLLACSAMHVEAVALRFQNVYGPGQSLANPYTGILSIFSTRLLNGKPVNIFEDGLESRDFVHVDDAVDGLLAALVRPEAAGHVIGIGSGVATSVLEVAQALKEQYGVDVPIEVTGAFRLGDIRHNLASLAVARERLGYRPRVAFASGIAQFATWVRAQAVAEDRYDRSLDEMRANGLYVAGTPDTRAR